MRLGESKQSSMNLKSPRIGGYGRRVRQEGISRTLTPMNLLARRKNLILRSVAGEGGYVDHIPSKIKIIYRGFTLMTVTAFKRPLCHLKTEVLRQ